MGGSFFDRLINHSHNTVAQSNDDQIKSQIVINNISDGIAIVDKNGIVQLFNPAAEALLGWKASDAISLDYRSVFAFYNSGERPIQPEENPIVIAMRTSKQANADNLYIETASKHKLLISIRVTPIIDNQSNVANGVVMVFRDITRERADQNAQADFISTASHEMRTPVAIIEGYLGMILNPELSTIDDRARSYAEKAHDSVKHLGRLFQDLLDVTKADDHRMENNPTLIDANIAAARIVEDFQNKAQSKGLSLSLEGATNTNTNNTTKIMQPISIIYVDLDQLNEVLGNIVDNAVKYTKTGSITVRVKTTDGRTRFEVTDTGIGIPPEDIPHLFQKFYRIDNSDTREIGGTGLGLYLIKKLTTNMGGTVGVDSVYGKGSTFWIEFDSLNRNEAIQKAREIKARNQSKEDNH